MFQDLKPQNIGVNTDGNKVHIRVLDMGHARYVDENLKSRLTDDATTFVYCSLEGMFKLILPNSSSVDKRHYDEKRADSSVGKCSRRSVGGRRHSRRTHPPEASVLHFRKEAESHLDAHRHVQTSRPRSDQSVRKVPESDESCVQTRC